MFVWFGFVSVFAHPPQSLRDPLYTVGQRRRWRTSCLSLMNKQEKGGTWLWHLAGLITGCNGLSQLEQCQNSSPAYLVP